MPRNLYCCPIPVGSISLSTAPFMLLRRSASLAAFWSARRRTSMPIRRRKSRWVMKLVVRPECNEWTSRRFQANKSLRWQATLPGDEVRAPFKYAKSTLAVRSEDPGASNTLTIRCFRKAYFQFIDTLGVTRQSLCSSHFSRVRLTRNEDSAGWSSP